MTDDEERVLAELLVHAVIHDDLAAKIAAARLLNYNSQVELSLVYRVAYLVRASYTPPTFIPDSLLPTNGDTPE